LQAGRVGAVYRRNAIFYALVGILFAGFGVMQIRWMGWQGLFLLAIGVFLLYAAIANYLESRKYKYFGLQPYLGHCVSRVRNIYERSTQ